LAKPDLNPLIFLSAPRGIAKFQVLGLIHKGGLDMGNGDYLVYAMPRAGKIRTGRVRLICVLCFALTLVFLMLPAWTAGMETKAVAATSSAPASSTGAGSFRAAQGRSHQDVPVTGGSKTQRADAKKYLKKWGKYSWIRFVKFQKSGHSGLTTLYSDGTAGIVISSKVTGKKLRQVLVHEIAHAQHNWIYAGNWAASIKAFKSVFGKGKGQFGPLENAADCSTQHLTKSKANLAYKKKGCSAKELSHAKKLAQGYRI
jgi:hypothetical protein